MKIVPAELARKVASEEVYRIGVVEESGQIYVAILDEEGEIRKNGRLLEILPNGSFVRVVCVMDSFPTEIETGKVRVIL